MPDKIRLSETDVADLRAIGDNSGSMALKGASTEYEGESLADRWTLDSGLDELAARWRIEPRRDLVKTR